MIENRSNDCISESAQQEFCLGSFFQPRTITLNNVPGYPSSCTFKISFEYKWCEVNPGIFDEVQVLMRNFDIVEIDCPQYDQEVDDLINNPCNLCPTVEEYLLGLDEKLISLASLDIMNLLKQTHNFNFDCPSGSNLTPFVFSYFQYSCHSYCLRRLTKTRGGMWLKPIRYECNGTVCCQVSHSMCIDSISGDMIIEINKTSSSQGEEYVCVKPIISNQICFYQTDCIHSCEN
jgi:hypothetical protein